MFWIGILPSVLVFYIQRHVPEPEVFQKTRAREVKLSEGSRFLDIFSPALLQTTLLAALLATGAQGGYYAITTWLPTYLKTTRGLSVLDTGGYLFVVIAGSFLGYMVGAWLTDRIGRRRTLVLYACCSLLAVVAYTYLPIGNSAMLLLGFPLGFFASGSFSPIGAFFTELFPTRLRGSGQGFSYNVGRGIGALFPTLVGYLSAHMGLGRAISAFAVAAYLAMIVATLLLPETRGRELRAYQ
jgi:fucose permease